jgi:hypothetical protein
MCQKALEQDDFRARQGPGGLLGHPLEQFGEAHEPQISRNTDVDARK